MLAEDVRTVGLGSKDTVERSDRLILDQLVFDDPGAMNNAINPPILTIELANNRTECSFISYVNRDIVHVRAGLLDRPQIWPYLSLVEDRPVYDLDLCWCHRLILSAQAGDQRSF